MHSSYYQAVKKLFKHRAPIGRPNPKNILFLQADNKCTAFIIIYFNVPADTQIRDLLPAYRTIISKNLRFYDITV